MRAYDWGCRDPQSPAGFGALFANSDESVQVSLSLRSEAGSEVVASSDFADTARSST